MFDLRQNTLFGSRTISTIGFDEQQMIRDILHLHCGDQPIDCDPTYSVGNFYKHGLPKPKWRFDIEPQIEGVMRASADNLPLEDESIGIEMFDPPFLLARCERKEETSDIIGDRFTRLKDWNELQEMYGGAMLEAYRILRPGGVLIFKNQDVVSNGKNHFSHVWIMIRAVEIGFYPKDLFVLLNKNRILDGREQQHARKYHCYFWVFEKKTSRVKYGVELFSNSAGGV